MDFKRYLPHAAAIVIFFLVTAFFFSPLVFDGKQMRQGDVDQFLGASKEIKDFREKTGTEPLWTNSMFGGMPAYQISTAYPNNAVQYIQKAFMTLLPSPAPIVLIGMIGFYFLLISLSINPWVSISGSIAYGLSSYLIVIIQAGHNTQAVAVAYMAPVLMGVLLTMRGKLLLGGALTALALALEFYSNHLQITYYLMILVIFVGIGEAIRLFRAGESKYLVKAVGILGIAAVIAILPNITNLLVTQEYGKASTRGQSDITVDEKEQTKTAGLPIEYATQWSYGKGETFSLMIPNINGGASDAIASYDESALENVDPNFKDFIGQGMTAYFGGQPFTSGPVYVGAIVCFLFILGLFIVKDSIKWWLLAATVLSIFLAWGHNWMDFTKLFFYHFPGYNKFRAVYMILVIAQLAMPLLAMLTLRELVKNPSVIKENMWKFYVSFAVTGGIALLIYSSPSSFVTPSNDSDKSRIEQAVNQQGGSPQMVGTILANLETARLDIVKGDAGRSFMFILLAAGIVLLYSRKPFGVPLFAGAFILLMLVDMWGVGHRYMTKDNYEPKKGTENHFVKSKADEMILQDPDPDYRVLNLATSPWQDAKTSYFHKSIGGYHGAKLKRIQELYEQVMENELHEVVSALNSRGGDSAIRVTLSHQSALNMLNTKYIIYNPEGGVITNRYACGNAWFVSNLKMVADADEEIKTVGLIDPRSTAIVAKDFDTQLNGFKPKYDSTASIKLVSYAPNDMKYESNASSEQLAVFSEIYYDKGWSAYVDGKPVDYFRTDFTLRGMRVPAGKHQVEFKFEPSSYYSGEKMALAGSILLFLFVGGAIYLDARKKKQENAAKAA